MAPRVRPQGGRGYAASLWSARRRVPLVRVAVDAGQRGLTAPSLYRGGGKLDEVLAEKELDALKGERLVRSE
jgi:hypothetical protein